MLVEVMMSALLVALAATAVFKGIDGATATSAQSKSRAVATNLAQEDQERLRAMDPRKLASYSPTPVDKTVNRVNYTVASSAQWVSDRGDTESCTKGDGRVVYVRITSTVTWPDMRGSKPVSASSLVAIANSYAKGSLAVKVVDRDAAAIPAIPVALDAPDSQTKSTNDQGCVVFDGLSPGGHFGQFSKTGYVDMNGASVVRPVNGWNVSTGATGISTHVYDQAGSASFDVVTKVNGTDYPAKVAGVVVTHPQIPGPPTPQKVEHNFSTPQSSDQFTNLFPFTSAYSAYPLACAGTQAGSTTYPLTVPRGGAANGGSSITMRLPSVNVPVTKNGAAAAGMDVKIRPATGSCMAAPNPRTWLTTATESQPSPYGDRGLPPGSYTLCVDDNNGSSTRFVSQTITVGTADLTVATVNVRTSGGSQSPSGSCP